MIFGDSKGGLSWWVIARDSDGEQRFKHIRSFQIDASAFVEITAEQRRSCFQVFAAGSELLTAACNAVACASG